MTRVGSRFGRLKVLRIVSRGRRYCECRCDCGETRLVRPAALLSGDTKSCGCAKADPELRRAARLKVDAPRRKEIAAMGAASAVRGKRYYRTGSIEEPTPLSVDEIEFLRGYAEHGFDEAGRKRLRAIIDSGITLQAVGDVIGLTRGGVWAILNPQRRDWTERCACGRYNRHWARQIKHRC